MLLSLVIVLLAACGKPDQAQPKAAKAMTEGAGTGIEAAASQISADYLRQIVVEISDDKYEGRGPGSQGDVAVRRYLARQLEQMGIMPGAADGSWEQPFDLVGVTAKQPEEWVFKKDNHLLALKQWDEFIVSSGVQADQAVVKNAQVVFVGYGIQAPEYDWDDYKGQDLSGKVVLIMNNDPD